MNLTGSQFTFAFGGTQANQFYVASLDVASSETRSVPVPDGGATIALMGLSTIGLGVFRARFGKQ